MSDIDISKISQAISQKLGEKVELVTIEKIGSGFHAHGYKVTAKDGRHFFIKRVHTDEMGFEFPERKLASLLVGHNMANRFGTSPRSIGLIVENGDHSVVLPDITEETTIYNIQEFEPEGAPYNLLLDRRQSKIAMDAEDFAELEAITDYAAKLHTLAHPSGDTTRRQALYNSGLRGEVMHPELTLTFMHDFGEEHPLLPPQKQEAYIGLVLNLLHKWKNREDRLQPLHGDFWGANVFLRQDKSVWVIDYSRVPWGDPGIDLGRWMSQYLWYYHLTKNPYYKELGDAFLHMYQQKTGDEEIMEAISLGFISMGVLYAIEGIYPDAPQLAKEDTYNNIIDILKENRFHWKG